MRRRLLGAAALALFTLAPAAAAAQWKSKFQGNRLGGEFDWWSTENSDSLTWGIVGQIELVETLHLDFDLPFAYGAISFDRGPLSEDFQDDGFAFGNPTVGVHYADTLTRNVALLAGGTISVSPNLGLILFNSDGDDDSGRFYATYLSSASRAYFDEHRIAPEYLFIRPRVGVEARFASVFYYRGDLAPVVWIPIGEYVEDTELVLDQGNELEARANIGLGGGLRFQQVILVTAESSSGDIVDFDDDDTDRAQTAVEPYFVYEPDEGFTARLGLLVALDDPLGFGFDDGFKVATLRVQLGGKW
jgi:hypothetical protein